MILNGDARSQKEAWPWWQRVGISREEAHQWEAVRGLPEWYKARLLENVEA